MTFTKLKDACAEDYFNLIDKFQALKMLIESDDPPMSVIEETLEGAKADLNALFGKIDSAAMQEHRAPQRKAVTNG